ncbi:uncharacterized protein PHACADRAFT_207813 [Phanerochaete carnosa HHB-10118-sp]|uniref:DUF6533 domain-containing protein n=1 Tax=Phanerochaete carnosa (strain HHB-10118-sp) TaxID=650164 RepID=K5WBL2_PHACS|nr:uncharacterized protein PHACADRAFT_207813 [Phanerochaete carnosa HHB-10118-sp]EKM56610.1 hypothetical protein PHACADRAFT_207813 [Phanerochaete carnosa HHB-10118-sp]
MSVTGSWDVADLVAAFRDAWWNRSLTIAPFALLYYDYLLTLPAEVERYWTADLNLRRSPIWFLICRYLSLVGNIPVLVQAAWPVNDQRFAVARHHAPAPAEPAAIGCNVATSSALGSDLAIAWGGMLCHDIVIFTLTLYKALSLRGGSRNLVDIILRDGTMYFGLIMCSTSITAFTFQFARPIIKGVTSTFTNILSTTLIARLMLNIRDPKLMKDSRYSTSRLQRTTSSGSDDPIVTSALDTAGMPEWTELSYELEVYQDEGPTHGTRHDVIELVRRDHPPERSKGKTVSWSRTEMPSANTSEA